MKAAIFTRVSSARQVEHGYSLGEQEERLRRYAAEQDWSVVESYCEPGVTVTKRRKRPELERMLEDAAAGKFGVFLGIAVDRIGRSMGETHRVLEALDRAEVRILSVLPGGAVDELSKGSPGATAKRGAFALAAELEAESIRDRARAGAAAKTARGSYVGGQRPFGYEQPPGEGLQPHPREAPLVREAFTRYADGESLRALAADLDRRGVGRPNGGRWSASRVAELLDHALYIGELAPGKRGRHEPLIGDDLWQRVRALRAAKHALHPKGGRHPRRHLLAGGLLLCGRCGQSFYTRSYQAATDVYRCRGKDAYNTPPTHCGMPPVPREVVDRAVRAIAARIPLTTESADAQVKARAAQARKDAKTAAAEVAKYERRLRHARDEWMDRAMTRAEYGEAKAEYEAALTAAREREAAARALERDLSANGRDHAQAIRQARELATNERPSDEERDRYRAWLEAHFRPFTLYVRPATDTDPPTLENELAERQRRALEGVELPEFTQFAWKPRTRWPEQIGTLVAEWRPEVEARFAPASADATPAPISADAAGLVGP